MLKNEYGEYIPIDGSSGREYKAYITDKSDIEHYCKLTNIKYEGNEYILFSNQLENYFGTGFNEKTKFIAVKTESM